MLKKILIPMAAAAALAVLPVSAETSISQFGITWTFDKDYPSGQYANGDWWVVGPVTITGISPASTVKSGRTVNGSQLNPGLGDTQGYDSAPGDMKYDEKLNAGRPNGKDLSPANPLRITTGSLVSSISLEKLQTRPQLQTAAILTVVESAPEEGSFRPPPVGKDKTSRWNKNNLDYSILRSLQDPGGMPPLSKMEKAFEKPWLEQNPNWTARYIHPQDNQPAYGRDMAILLAEGLLSLHLDYSNEEKETLLIRLVQYGIDVYGTAREGGMWEDLGGHNPGRKMPMILAGLTLKDPEILEYADASKNFIFQEDRQTWYVTESDVGRTLYTADKRPREPYTRDDIGIAEWGEQHTRAQIRDGRNWDTYYRDICIAAMTGHALAAHLTPGATELWNWPAFFDYIDRAFSISGQGAGGGSNTIPGHISQMWKAYRYKFADPKGTPK